MFAAFLSTGKDHRDGGRPCEVHKVEPRGRVGALPGAARHRLPEHGVQQRPQSAAEYVGRMRQLGLSRFRIDLLREAPAEVAPRLGRYAAVVNGTATAAAAERVVRPGGWWMAGVKDCPTCGLVNPPDAQRCDCGYDFVSRSVEASYLGKRDPHADDPTLAETLIVFFSPPFGLLLGAMARSQGRRQAGNKLLILSGGLILVPLAIFAIYVALQ